MACLWQKESGIWCITYSEERELDEARRKHLESLVGKENRFWSQVYALIATNRLGR